MREQTISWIFDLEGEEGFRKREERIINELTQLQGVVLSTGGGAVMSKEIVIIFLLVVL